MQLQFIFEKKKNFYKNSFLCLGQQQKDFVGLYPVNSSCHRIMFMVNEADLEVWYSFSCSTLKSNSGRFWASLVV